MRKNLKKLQKILSFKHAYLLEQFSALGGDEYPSIDDAHLCFYADRKGWGLAGRDDYPQDIVEQDYYNWEREYLYRDNTINFKEVRENQEQYLFYCNYFQLNELIDVMPKPGSHYVRSVCEPFNEEMLFDERRVRNWLELLGLGEAYQVHASGHASYPELKKMVEDINPKKVIPIHTEHPELFKQMHDNVECPKLRVRAISDKYKPITGLIHLSYSTRYWTKASPFLIHIISLGIWTATRCLLLSSRYNCALRGVMAPSVSSTFAGTPTSCHQYGSVKPSCNVPMIPMRKGHPLSSGMIHSVLRQLRIFPKIGSFALTIPCSTSSFLANRGILRARTGSL